MFQKSTGFHSTLALGRKFKKWYFLNISHKLLQRKRLIINGKTTYHREV